MLASDLVGKKFTVHKHGHVLLMDYMGGDEAVLDAARTAYQKGTTQVSDDRTLIRYLMRHSHTSPFECCTLKFHVKLPIFVERQWARHRTAGWNEVSARYSELPEEFYIPPDEDVREQSKTNKQGRDAELAPSTVDEFIEHCEAIPKAAFQAYHEDLENGVARELARVNLPLGTYTEKVWWINLHNLFHFLSLRMDSHAQKEIRDYATIIGEQIVAPLFPMCWEAFNDYNFRRDAMLLTALDVKAIQGILKTGLPDIIDDLFINKREGSECITKLKKLGFSL